MRDSRGRVWFTLVDGFAICDPKNITTNTTKPVMHIERVSVDDKIVYPVDTNGKIILPAGTKRVSIKFAGLSFVSSDLVRFNYKLDGFDADYSDWETLRTASYTNLTPGTYRFHISAMNSDGIMSDEDSSIQFVQQAFLYQHVWFWGVVAILVVLIIFVLVRGIVTIINQLKVLKSAIAELSSGNADLTKRVKIKKTSVFKIFDELVQEENRFLDQSDSHQQVIDGTVARKEVLRHTDNNNHAQEMRQVCHSLYSPLKCAFPHLVQQHGQHHGS